MTIFHLGEFFPAGTRTARFIVDAGPIFYSENEVAIAMDETIC